MVLSIYSSQFPILVADGNYFSKCLKSALRLSQFRTSWIVVGGFTVNGFGARTPSGAVYSESISGSELYRKSKFALPIAIRVPQQKEQKNTV